MPIKQITPQSDIDSYINQQVDAITQAIVYNLSHIGELVRNEAIDNGSYDDHTKHLRGSVGYVVIIDGNIKKMGDFGRADSPSAAKSEGASFARSLASKFPTGIILVVVAGKEYASYVSAKGKNVLESSELLADRIVPKMLKKLGFK